MYEGTKSLRILLKDSADWREMKWVNLEHIVLRKVSAANSVLELNITMQGLSKNYFAQAKPSWTHLS